MKYFLYGFSGYTFISILKFTIFDKIDFINQLFFMLGIIGNIIFMFFSIIVTQNIHNFNITAMNIVGFIINSIFYGFMFKLIMEDRIKRRSI